MLYDYYCDKCNETWEESHLSAERDKPLETPCTKCGGPIKRGVCSPAIASDTQHPIKRAGNEWNDVLKGIKKASGKENTIDTY
jgi:predicted nucleic acid-binding Zn ribbon protein